MKITFKKSFVFLILVLLHARLKPAQQHSDDHYVFWSNHCIAWNDDMNDLDASHGEDAHKIIRKLPDHVANFHAPEELELCYRVCRFNWCEQTDQSEEAFKKRVNQVNKEEMVNDIKNAISSSSSLPYTPDDISGLIAEFTAKLPADAPTQRDLRAAILMYINAKTGG
jgi:hypothetical protein